MASAETASTPALSLRLAEAAFAADRPRVYVARPCAPRCLVCLTTPEEILYLSVVLHRLDERISAGGSRRFWSTYPGVRKRVAPFVDPYFLV